MSSEGGVKDHLAMGEDVGGLAVVDHGGGHQTESGMMMLVVVPVKEGLADENKPVGSSATLQNSQCMIGAASVAATALSTTLTLDITFTSTFTGLKNVYMYGADGDGSINTGWVQKGTWIPNP